MKFVSLFALLQIGVYCSVLQAQPTPFGNDFQVNLNTADRQSSPSATVLGDGFVVVWTDFGVSPGGDNDSASVQGRLVDGDGSPVGDQFQVNTHTTGGQGFVAATSTAGGGFVATWENVNAADPDRDVRARVFDSIGNPLGPDFPVNDDVGIRSTGAQVVGTPFGGFMVTWIVIEVPSFPFISSIYSRLFDANGQPGPQFRVSEDLSYTQGYNSVQRAADGGYIVAWSGEDEDFSGILWRHLDASGAPVGTIRQLNTETTGPQNTPSGIYNPRTGETLFAWNSGFIFQPPVPGSSNIRARRIGSNGEPIGDDFQVSQSTTTLTLFSDVTVDFFGNYFLVYQREDQPIPEAWVGAQWLSPTGQPLGEDLQLNSFTDGLQSAPTIAGPLADGTYLSAWTSDASPGDDNSVTSIVARIFRGPPTPALAIPMASTYGLLALALAIALAGGWLLRR